MSNTLAREDVDMENQPKELQLQEGQARFRQVEDLEQTMRFHESSEDFQEPEVCVNASYVSPTGTTLAKPSSTGEVLLGAAGLAPPSTLGLPVVATAPSSIADSMTQIHRDVTQSDRHMPVPRGFNHQATGSKAIERKKTITARRQKRKKEEDIPYLGCYHLSTPYNSSLDGHIVQKLKRNKAACAACRRKRIKCSHGHCQTADSFGKPTGFDIFMDQFTVTVQRNGMQETHDADKFPFINRYGHFVNVGGVAHCLRTLDVDHVFPLKPGSVLLSSLNTLYSDPRPMTTVRSRARRDRLEAIGWIIWLCYCRAVERDSGSISEARKCSSLIQNLKVLRARALQCSTEPQQDINAACEEELESNTRAMCDPYLTFVALKVRDCAFLETIVERYFQSVAAYCMNCFDWLDWWTLLLCYLPQSELLAAIKEVSNLRTSSGIWQMALHGSHIRDNFDLTKSLLAEDRRHQALFSAHSHHVRNIFTHPGNSDKMQDIGVNHAAGLWLIDAKVRKEMLEGLLVTASMKGEHESALYLLQAGADPNCVEARGDRKVSPLSAAVAAQSDSVVGLLLERGALPDSSSAEHGSPLHSAAEKGNCNIVKCLLDAGANVNAKTDGGMSALHLAAGHGWHDIVVSLLDAGAKVNLQEQGHDSALSTAASQGHTAIVDRLISAGADIHASGVQFENALEAAASSRSKSAIQLLLRKGAKLSRSSSRWALLLADAAAVDQDHFQLLLAAGLDAHLDAVQHPRLCDAPASPQDFSPQFSPQDFYSPISGGREAQDDDLSSFGGLPEAFRDVDLNFVFDSNHTVVPYSQWAELVDQRIMPQRTTQQWASQQYATQQQQLPVFSIGSATALDVFVPPPAHSSASART